MPNMALERDAQKATRPSTLRYANSLFEVIYDET